MEFFENDLFVIVKLAFPSVKKVVVLDPAKVVVRNYNKDFFFAYTRDQITNIIKEQKHFLLVNMSGAASFSFPFDFTTIEGIISFNGLEETSLDFYHYNLCYVVDQQNKVRWLISENHKQTDFLNEYYKSQFVTDVSNFFSSFSSLINYLNVKWGKLKKVTDGSCQILKRDKHFFTSIDNSQYDSFTVNLKDHTLPGLIRIKLYKGIKNRWVINHAINTIGHEKITNEKRILTEISKNTYNYFAISEYFVSDFNVVYSIEPSFKSADTQATKKIINSTLTNAVLEFQCLYSRESTLKKYWRDHNILSDLNWIRSRIAQDQIPRGISALNFTKLYTNILQIFNELDLDKCIRLGLNNNHLNSENIFSSGNKLFFTSWGNADFDLPLFYDLFQTVVNYADENTNADHEIILTNLQLELENQILKDFAIENNIDINIQFKTFIIFTFITEIKKLVVKKTVLPETNIKIYIWLEITNRFLSILK